MTRAWSDDSDPTSQTEIWRKNNVKIERKNVYSTFFVYSIVNTVDGIGNVAWCQVLVKGTFRVIEIAPFLK